jgi:hypothetical protein
MRVNTGSLDYVRLAPHSDRDDKIYLLSDVNETFGCFASCRVVRLARYRRACAVQADCELLGQVLLAGFGDAHGARRFALG